MNEICTSIEQSKKLLELGVDANTADMCHRYRWSNNSFINLPCTEKAREPITGDIPAWSLAALLGVLPIIYTNDKKEVCGPLHIDITDSETPFVLWYVNPLHKGGIVELQTKEYDNLVDACYEMIIKLHELKLL